MQSDSLDLGTVNIPTLFRSYFIPTLFGMLSLCAVTTIDGVFVGQGVGSDALAAVNICIPPTMLMMGVALMLGVGASVVASIHLANNNIKAARVNSTQALVVATIVVLLFLVVALIAPAKTGAILGSSDTLMPLVLDYMPWIFMTCLFQIWAGIGLFVVRLDGSPRYAMWCNVLPGLLNIVLDYLFIFPLNMGIAGAGIATFISCFVGGAMVLIYLFRFASKLRLINLKVSAEGIVSGARNIFYQCKIGVSALLGEATMGMLMLVGNIVFMHYMGDAGVGAFSIACYYCPFVFMIGNAIAQSAQPIISYNYGLGSKQRVVATECLAIKTALLCGILVTLAFVFVPSPMVHLFLSGDVPAVKIAIDGFPIFAMAFVFFIFNLTAIGYFQSVEKSVPSVVFALLRGVIFLIPAFVVMPILLGNKGIWMALSVSEILTSISVVGYYIYNKVRK